MLGINPNEKMTMIKKILAFAVCISLSFLAFTSCESDDEITNTPPEAMLTQKAQDIFVGDIVLSTRATMNSVDKTLLPSGCPTKFNFSWREDGRMVIGLTDFQVGKMPLQINFRCACKFMNLNSWEKDEYKGDGWIKFLGKDGKVTSVDSDTSDTQSGSGATVQGYLNVYTMETEFIINYNMMNVRTETFLQKIDKDRVKNFDAEFAQYEADLQKWKEEHGLN